jgi:uncharacterized protein (DUF2235 family)
MTKKLIGFIAGTWGGGSNVRRLVSALRPTDDHGSDQISYYDHGVGGMRGIRRQIAGATGLGISRLNKELYSWLSHRFLPDDQIFLFGFSRGAYGVRSLAGLISRCGSMELSRTS